MKKIFMIMMCLFMSSLGLSNVYAIDYDVIVIDELYDVIKTSESDYEGALERVWEDSCVASLKYAGFGKDHFLSYYDLMMVYTRGLSLDIGDEQKETLVIESYAASLPESFITLVDGCGDRSEVLSTLHQISYESIAVEEHLKDSDDISRYLQVSDSFEVSLKEALNRDDSEVTLLADQMRLLLELQVIVLNDSFSKEDMECLFEMFTALDLVSVKDVDVLTETGKKMVVIEEFIPHRSSDTLMRDLTLLKSQDSIALETFESLAPDVKKETLSPYMDLVEQAIVDDKLIGSDVDLLMTTVEVIHQVDTDRLTELKHLILVSMIKELRYIPDHSNITQSDIEETIFNICEYSEVFDESLKECDGSEHMIRIEMTDLIKPLTLDQSAISSLINSECQVLIVDGDLMIRLTLEDLLSSQWITYQSTVLDAVEGDYKTFDLMIENDQGVLRDVIIFMDNPSSKGDLTLSKLSNNQFETLRYQEMYGKLVFNHSGDQYRLSGYKSSFKDIDMWGKGYILEVVSKGWMTGVTDISFSPEDVVSRHTLTEILMEWTDQITYEDLSDRPLTRGDMAEMICRAYESKYGYELSSNGKVFSDHKEIPRDIRKSIYKLRAAGIVSGYSDNSFRVNQEVTRAELAVVLTNLLNE